MKKLNFILLFTLFLSAGFLLNSQKSLAVSASDWKPGRIIDDVVFQNKQAMTVQQIQQFLDSKVPTCDRWGTLPMWSGGPSRAQWSADNGRDLAPYTCLKEYVENPTTKANNGADPTISVPGGLSAAQLIYNASQAQNINPQVFLVLLQKEQSLVTDDWPYAKQFERATGNNCPDTAPCDPAYAWLSTQVNNAGAQFNYYVTHFSQYNYAPGWNNILYNPNTACGRQSVFIENAFTAALYIYTPYVPNQAALDNMYGTGDGCSAYGNRNFWRLFNDWFGSSLAPQLLAQPAWQSVFTDSTKSTALGWGATLIPKQSAYAVVVFKNIGNSTWARSGGTYNIMIGTSELQDRQSAFCVSMWTHPCNRPALLNETAVAPGSYGTFEFPITAPQVTGFYKESFSLVANGYGFFPSTMNFPITVEPEKNSSVPVWQGIYSDATKAQFLGWNANLLKGQSAYAVVLMKNTGNIPWTKNGGGNDVMLGTVLAQDRQSTFCTAGWLNPCNRTVKMVEATVAPGSYGTFEFPITAPQTAGTYSESFGLVVNGKGYFPGGFMNFQLGVQPEKNSSVPVWQGIYSDATKAQFLGWNANLLKGQSAYAVVLMKNTGNIPWTKNGGGNDVMLGTVLAQDRQSTFCTAGWLNPCNRTVKMVEATVAPGSYGTFEFPITAPQTAGTYSESFGLVVNGKGYFPGGFMNFQLGVQP
jgi:hypothetical protein